MLKPDTKRTQQYQQEMLRREQAAKTGSVNQRANAADKLAFAKCRNAGGTVADAKRAGELAFSAVVAQAIEDGDTQTLEVSAKYEEQRTDWAAINRAKWTAKGANPYDGTLKRCSRPGCGFEGPRVNDGTWTIAVTKADGLNTLCRRCRAR